MSNDVFRSHLREKRPLCLGAFSKQGFNSPRLHLHQAQSRRELVHAAVVVLASVNRGAVKVSKTIDDHSVIGKGTIWRPLERMNYSLNPLTAANRTQLKDDDKKGGAFSNRATKRLRHWPPDLSHSLQSCGRPFGLAR